MNQLEPLSAALARGRGRPGRPGVRGASPPARTLGFGTLVGPAVSLAYQWPLPLHLKHSSSGCGPRLRPFEDLSPAICTTMLRSPSLLPLSCWTASSASLCSENSCLLGCVPMSSQCSKSNAYNKSIAFLQGDFLYLATVVEEAANVVLADVPRNAREEYLVLLVAHF